MKIKYKKIREGIKSPTKAYAGDAGLDIYCPGSFYIPQGHMMPINTGLAFEIPKGWHMQVHTRSSQAKNGLRIHLGIVDSGYRGELLVWVHNTNTQTSLAGDYVLTPGEKLCQLLFLPVPEIELEETDTLSESERGEKGHGSSGK